MMMATPSLGDGIQHVLPDQPEARYENPGTKAEPETFDDSVPTLITLCVHVRKDEIANQKKDEPNREHPGHLRLRTYHGTVGGENVGEQDVVDHSTRPRAKRPTRQVRL